MDCIERYSVECSDARSYMQADQPCVLESLLEDVRKSFGKKFAQKIIDGNIEATKRGYGEVKEG